MRQPPTHPPARRTGRTPNSVPADAGARHPSLPKFENTALDTSGMPAPPTAGWTLETLYKEMSEISGIVHIPIVQYGEMPSDIDPIISSLLAQRNCPPELVEQATQALRPLLQSAFATAHSTLDAILSGASTSEKVENTVKEDLVLPDKAPELYGSTNENSHDFYWRVWGAYAKSGILYQDILDKYDSKLMKSIRNYCSYRKINIEETFHLPTREARTERDAINGSVRAKFALMQRAYRKEAAQPR